MTPEEVWRALTAEWAAVAPAALTLAVYAGGILLYALLVFTFYERVSRPRLVRDGPERRNPLLRAGETLLAVPALAYAYFLLLAAALIFLAKTRQTDDVILLALAVVLGIRLASALSPGIAVDLAKLLPLGLLAVVLVEPGYFELEEGLQRAREAIDEWRLFVWAAVGLVLTEIIVQAALAIKRRVRGPREAPAGGTD